MLSQLKLTILDENRVVNPKLIAEQGLSILVETRFHNILFDTGQTDAFLKNAKQLNLDLSSVKTVVLSHGHYDLTGGLEFLLQKHHPLDIVCHPNLFNKKYRMIDLQREEIGVPWEKKRLEEKGANFVLRTHPKEIFPGIWVSGEIPRLTDYEFIDETYQEKVLESYIHDEIHDEQALILETKKGLVILMGCGHAGPINTIKHAMRILHQEKIHAVVGGMHLHRAPDEKIKKIVKNLIRLNPDFVIPLHCCGFRTINQFFNHFKERVRLLNVGDSFTVE